MTVVNMASGVIFLASTTLVFIWIYKLANAKVGLEQIGIWSILGAVSSVGNMGTFGLGGSIVRFAADAHARHSLGELAGLINDLLRRMAGLLAVFLIVLYMASKLALGYFVDAAYLPQALVLLPISLGIFWVNALAQLLLSAIEGLNLVWKKNVVSIVGQVGMAVLTYMLIGGYGIQGLLIAQLAQVVFLVVSAFVLLHHDVPGYSLAVWRGEAKRVKSAMEYGLKFQAQSFLQLLCDPVTKMFLSRYGGLSIVGYYEMANRIILQLRQIILNVMTSLLPRLVRMQVTSSPTRVEQVYRSLFAVNMDLYLLVFGAVFLFCPEITRIWLGHESAVLDTIIRILVVAWTINAISIVPYLFNLGSGDLHPNIISHGVMAGANFFLGLMVIVLNGPPIFFVIAWGGALAVGSAYLLLAYGRRQAIPLFTLFKPSRFYPVLLLLATASGLAVLLHMDWLTRGQSYLAAACLYVAMAIVTLRKVDSFVMIRTFISSLRGPDKLSSDL